MAAPALYQCRLSPHDCPTSTEPGYCTRHPWIELAPAPAGAPARTFEAEAAPPAPPAPARGWALRICALDALVPIPPSGLDIGRDSPRFAAISGMADLDQVSRRHARLSWNGPTLLLEDLGSTNGTYVAGTRITAPQPVAPGHLLRLAEDVDAEIVELDEDL